MATYKQIVDYIKTQYNITVKTCWIAHVKEMSGLNPKQAPNRISPTSRTNPCPDNRIEFIKAAFRYFGIVVK